MKSTVITLILLVYSILSSAQSFEKFASSLTARPPDQRTLALDKYFSSRDSIPLIEGNKVFFIYRGKADSVFIAGDATGWQPSLPMIRIKGTDTWYCKAEYETDARLEYKIVVNKKDWIVDPLNKRIVTGGTGQNSEILMPAYDLPRYIYERDVVPWGTYSDTVLFSKYLGESRPIRIYLPSGYENSSHRYPVAYFHDGFEFFVQTAARNILDNMIYEQKIRPLIAVFVQPVHRDDEYSGKLQAKYTKFMLEELIPFIDQVYKTKTQPESRVQFGISNGGNIALWLVASHPEMTAGVAAFSSNVMKNIKLTFLKNGCRDEKIYLGLGKYDLPMIIPMVSNLKQILEQRNCNVNFREYPEGHSWKFWQKYLPEALVYLFPPE